MNRLFLAFLLTLGFAITANAQVIPVGGGGAAGGAGGTLTSDADDASIAAAQTNSNVNGLTMVFDGTVWRRLTVGTAGTPASQVLSVQGIASGTPFRIWDGTDIVLIDGSGNMSVTCSNCSGSGVSVNEDVASADAHPGTPAYTVRNNTLTGATSADGDYQPTKSTAAGAIYTAPTFGDVVAVAGNGVAGTGVQRVTLASDSTGTLAGVTTVTTVSTVTSLSQLGGVALPVEDVAETAGGVGIYAMSVRRDTAASSAGISGDNATINTDSLGRLWITSAVLEDAAETVGGPILAIASVRRDTAASSAGTDGDNATINTDATGRLWVNTEIPDTATLADDTANPSLPAIAAYIMNFDGTTWDRARLATDAIEDAAETAGGGGPAVLTVRRDTAASSAGTTGDYATFNSDAIGRLWTVGAVIEDAAETTADSLISVGTVRRDTLASSAGASGDNATLNTNASGAVWTAPSAATNGGADSLSYNSVGTTEDEHAVKATAGTLYSITATNTNAAVRFIRCENDTAVNTAPGTDTPELDLAVPGATTGAGITFSFPVGYSFSTALTCWLVTGAAQTDVAEVAANELKIFYSYK